MPTLFTHALVGATVATLRDHSIKPTKLLVIAAVLAVLPDIDVIGFRNGIAYSSMLGHRGLTHSLPFAAGLSLFVTLAFFPEVRGSFSAAVRLFLLLFLATASHGVLDSFTDAGLGVGFLIPFDDTRYFAPWRPLTASPLSISRFFGTSGGAILMNEFRWVGIPLIVFAVSALLVRRKLQRARD